MIPTTKEIVGFFHCQLCIDELSEISRRNNQPQSPETYQRLEVGYTTIGIQVWCRRHQVNVMHFDFEGHNVPVNPQRAETPQQG
jgi:hypothetical protein